MKKALIITVVLVTTVFTYRICKYVGYNIAMESEYQKVMTENERLRNDSIVKTGALIEVYSHPFWVGMEKDQ